MCNMISFKTKKQLYVFVCIYKYKRTGRKGTFFFFFLSKDTFQAVDLRGAVLEGFYNEFETGFCCCCLYFFNWSANV